MRIFQCVAIAVLLAAANGQYLQGSYLPPRRQLSDSALYKFLSAVRGGGRGHRELLSLTGSGSSPSHYSAAAPPQFGLPFVGVGRLPPSVTHVPAPPKIGAFYITPPERNAPFYYGGNGVAGKKPHLVKITDLKNAQPGLTLAPAESSNRPRFPNPFNSLMQFVHLTSAGPVASASNGAPQQPHGAPQLGGGRPIQVQGNTDAGSLQEIIAKAAQEQHALVLQKEQKAHPNAQISSQILVPGGPGGQQPVFINQFGQPFLAPAILAPGQQGHPHNLPPQLLAGNGQGGVQLIGQGPGPVPPQALLQQIRQQQQQQQSLNSISDNSEKGQQQQQGSAQHQQQQQLGQLQQIQFLNSAGLQVGPHGQPIQFLQGGPQGQRIPLQFAPQQIQGGGLGGLFGLPQGAPHIIPSQFSVIPQGLRGPQGQLIPGNAILGHPHFAILGGPGLGGPQQGQQKGLSTSGTTLPGGEGQAAEKEEQPTRPLEAASQHSPSIAPLSPSNNGAQSHMTAAIMQSQLEFSEPIVKL